jgi:hypothetical protein
VACKLFLLKKNKAMKTRDLLITAIILTSFYFQAISKTADRPRHRPNPHYHHHYRSTQVVVAPARVIVPPPPVVMVAPRPVVVVAPPVTRVTVGAAYVEPRISSREAIHNAKRMMDDQRFEADRLRIAKNAARDLPLRTIDVLDMMNMFTFESTKLEFSKFAYSRIVDPQNYSMVFEAFKYTGSIKNLEDYMYERDERR